MNRKISFTALILVFVSISMAVFVVDAFRPAASGKVSDALAIEKKATGPGLQGKQKRNGHQVIAYYFHYKFRCPTCTRIEQLTQEAVTSGFQHEIKDGRLVLKIVNVDDKGNEHFMKDYGLQMQSVVIAETKDGLQLQWKNLDLIWDLVGDKQAFIKYIQDETHAYLGKG